MQSVLKNRPYHYTTTGQLSCRDGNQSFCLLFPQISFQIRLQGLPLHFQHEKVIYNIGLELGVLGDYEIYDCSYQGSTERPEANSKEHNS